MPAIVIEEVSAPGNRTPEVYSEAMRPFPIPFLAHLSQYLLWLWLWLFFLLLLLLLLLVVVFHPNRIHGTGILTYI